MSKKKSFVQPPSKKLKKVKTPFNFIKVLKAVSNLENNTKTKEMPFINAYLCPINNYFRVFKNASNVNKHLYGKIADRYLFQPGYINYFSLF
jgi:hypothetical protein